MKLTINHLKGYLDHKLKFIRIGEEPKFTLDGIYSNGDVYSKDLGEISVELIKPLLHPLSSLTKYREDLGFVPMVELFKISRGCFQMEINERYIEKISTNEYSFELGHRIYFFALHSFLDCDVRLGNNYYWKCYSTDLRFENKKEEQVFCQNILFEKLNEWHVDYQNLIKENLAIEIN